MKKIIVLILSVVMTFSLISAAGSVSADSMQVKIVRVGVADVYQNVTVHDGSVTLSKNGNNLVATTVDGTDPWIDVSLPDIDAWVYDEFYITYKASG